MSTERTVRGQTPHGGAYSVTSFLDDDGVPADEDAATRAVIREFDSEDRLIGETWGSLGPADSAEE